MDKKRRRFIIGLILLFVNTPLGWGGMVIFNSLALKYHEKFYFYIGTTIYAISWILLFLGGYLAGKEGKIYVKKFWKKTIKYIIAKLGNLFTYTKRG